MSFFEGKAVRTAWAGWIVLFLVTAAIIISGSGRTVVPAYREGAVSWLAGKLIYHHIGVGGFPYLPQAAILYIPFALLSVTAGEIAWRLANIAVFALGVYRFAGMAGARSAVPFFPLMSLVALPMAWDCARNGQATLAMTGLTLLALVNVAEERWWRATLWLVLGLCVKPLAVVPVLLVVAIDRPMSWRIGLGLLAAALAPFLTQTSGYVLEQYAMCWKHFTTAAHVGATDSGWTSPFHAVRLIGISVPEVTQTILRMAAALGTLALCWLSRRRHDAAHSAVYVFSLAAAYLMLFSPRTENNTYAMLGPAIGAYLAAAYLAEERPREGLLLGGIALAIVGGRVVERLLTPHAATSWVSPLMAVCFSAYLMARFFRDMQEHNQQPRIAQNVS